MSPAWHDGPLDALRWDGASPVAWSVADADRRAPHAARHRLAAVLIARLAGVEADAVRLVRGDAGAPVVAWPTGWHLGLSGREGHCLIGVATEPIAVDREPIDDAPPLWDMLTQAEADDLRRADAAARPREWLRRWTIKEAHAKLVGEPRRIAAEAIETTVVDAEHATARFEGRSRCWTRIAGGAVETAALWADAVEGSGR